MRVGRYAVATDPGRRRRRNEDAFVLEPPLFAVADGMGGAQAGEVASKLAAGALREDAIGELEARIQEANRRVHERSVEDPQASGMGTTMTAAVVDAGVVRFGHVGDSRAYLVRDGKLEQITQDHSLVGELVRSGKLSEEEAERHPQRSVITRAVGTDPDVDVDTFTVDPQEGDVFLICSDGLTDMVADDTIERLVSEKRDDLDALVKTLVRTANKGGGDDNITVIAFEIADGEPDLEATLVAPATSPDDEDTLTEADNVPTIDVASPVDTMVVSADELAAAYEAEQAAKKPPRKRRSDALLVLVVLLVFAALVLLALWGLYR